MRAVTERAEEARRKVLDEFIAELATLKLPLPKGQLKDIGICILYRYMYISQFART